MAASEREFELAVRSFSGDLYRFAFWLARDKYVAEELVQDCFGRAWRHWESLNDAQALKRWLFTILRREFLRRLDCKQLELVELEEADAVLAEQMNLDDAYGIRQALASAPSQLREVLLLQVLGGFSTDEIAELEKTTAGAINTRLSRARQWMRVYLSRDDGDVTNSENKGSRS